MKIISLKKTGRDIKKFSRATSEYEERNKSLEDNLRALEEENNYYRDIEETTKRDLESLKHDYNQKIAETERKELNNKRLQGQIDDTL